MARRLNQQERLFTLLLALIDTRTGLTRGELFDRVPGYREGGDGPSQQRMFERDKLLLRDAGYPIETIEDLDDNKFTRYRVSRQALVDPDELKFDSGERLLLAAALQLWDRGALGDDARLARMRLRADPEFPSQHLPVSSLAQAADPALGPLRNACDEGLLARFDYHRPGDEKPLSRRVEAWAVVLFGGRWLLYGWDQLREAPRMFLLRRIVSKVRTSALTDPAEPPADPAGDALDSLESLWQQQSAEVAAVPGSDADMRLRRRPGTEIESGRLRIHYSDLSLLADELTGYAADVEVLSPPQLVSAVRDRLEVIAAAHVPAAEGGADVGRA